MAWTAKKRRKQSNPVRYGQPSAPFDTFLGQDEVEDEEGEEDGDEEEPEEDHLLGHFESGGGGSSSSRRRRGGGGSRRRRPSSGVNTTGLPGSLTTRLGLTIGPGSQSGGEEDEGTSLPGSPAGLESGSGNGSGGLRGDSTRLGMSSMRDLDILQSNSNEESGGHSLYDKSSSKMKSFNSNSESPSSLLLTTGKKTRRKRRRSSESTSSSLKNTTVNPIPINYSSSHHQFEESKYQYYCPHCGSSFHTQETLKSHIEVEHVQKILEQQLRHHHQQLSSKSGSNGLFTSQERRSSEELPLVTGLGLGGDGGSEFHRSNSRGSTDSSDNSCNSSLNSPSASAADRKSFDSNLPHSSPAEQQHHHHHQQQAAALAAVAAAAAAKDFANILPFQLPNVPPLIPLSQSNSSAGSGGSGQMVSGSGPDGGKLSLSMYSNPMAPFLFPILPHGGGQGGGGQSGNAGSLVNGGPGSGMNPGGIRIFNPEAYCELCNKEFCNKYFLKTHKANKHGVFSADTAVPTSTSSFSSNAASAAAAAAAAFFPAGLTGSSAAAALQMQHLLQQASSAAASGASGPEVAQVAAAAMAVRSAGIINLESYCEICQKEFCNKYFLKKHKQKIHGLSLDSGQGQQTTGGHLQSSSVSPSSSLGGGDQSSQKVPNSPRSSPMSSMCPSSTGAGAIPSSPMVTTAVSLYSGEKHQQSSIMTAASSGGSTTPGETVCDVCKQEFPNSGTLQAHKITTHGHGGGGGGGNSQHPPTSIHSMLSSAQLQTMAALQAESLAGLIGRPIMVPSSMGEGGNIVFTPEKLREMGVINADAFCEICCKEFCNKYFLRTHKLNKHGISVDNNSSCGSTKSKEAGDNKQQLQSEESGNSNNNLNNNNLNSSNNNGSLRDCNEDSGLEPGQRDPNANHMLGSATDLSIFGSMSNCELNCEICSRPFSSNYLLRMHKFYSHNVPYVKEEEFQKSLDEQQLQQQQQQQQQGQHVEGGRNESTGDNKLSDSDQMSADQASQDLQKLQSMIKELNSNAYQLEKVNCSVCRQEFENKYFLRVHMINDHGLMPSEPDGFDTAALMRSMFDPSKVAFPSSLAGLQNPNSDMSGGGGGDSSEAFCEICQKEFCSKYFLRTHKQNIHGIFEGPPTPTGTSPLQQGQGSLTSQLQQQQQQQQQQQPLQLQLGQGSQKEGKESTLSRDTSLGGSNHKKANSTNVNSNNVPMNTSPNKPILPTTTIGADGKPKMITGRNYCNICNKELCNKYFMKTHMLKMHGINIDEHPAEAAVTSTIGGVTCDICQKELCSKYFLKVHKQNTHGIYEEPPQPKESRSGGGQHLSGQPGDNPSGHLDSSQRGGPGEHHHHHHHSATAVHGIDPSDTNNRYFSHYTEVCPLCERRFKSIKWLKTHMINDHSDLVAVRGAAHPPPPTSDNIHSSERNRVDSSDSFPRVCVLCGQTFSEKLALQIHLAKDHRGSCPEDIFSGLSGNPNSQSMKAIMSSVGPTDLSLSSSANYGQLGQHQPQQQQQQHLFQQHFHHHQQQQQLNLIRQEHLSKGENAQQLSSESCQQSSSQINGRTSSPINGTNLVGTCNNTSSTSTATTTYASSTIAVAATTTTGLGAGGSSIENISSNNVSSTQAGAIKSPTSSIESGNLLPTALQQSSSKSGTSTSVSISQSSCGGLGLVGGGGGGGRGSITSTTTSTTNTTTTTSSSSPSSSSIRATSSSVSSSLGHNKARTTETLLGETTASSFSTTGSLSTFSLKRTISGTRIYQCSYCSYSTRWLSNLYAHEKRHTRLHTEGDKKFVCRICHRAYRYNHSLQRHLHNHRAAGLNLRELSSLSSYSSPHSSHSLAGQSSSTSANNTTSNNNGSNSHQKASHSSIGRTHSLSGIGSYGSSSSGHLVSHQGPDRNNNNSSHTRGSNPQSNSDSLGKVKRYRCSKCNKKFRTRDLCLAHIHVHHTTDSRKILVSTSGYRNMLPSKQFFRCAACGFASRHYHLLRSHINKQHSDRNQLSTGETSTKSTTAQQQQQQQLQQTDNPSSPLNLRKSPDSSNVDEALSLVVKDRIKTSLSPMTINYDLFGSLRQHQQHPQQSLPLSSPPPELPQQQQRPPSSQPPTRPPSSSSNRSTTPPNSGNCPQQLPMAYPMPQSAPSSGSFIMQPFLISQPDTDISLKNETFVPSLVYLPVSQKVLQPVTVAFQLTPA